MRFSPPRRHVLSAALGAALVFTLAGCGGWTGRAAERGPIVALLPADAANASYSKAVQRGLDRITKELAIPVETLEYDDAGADAERQQALRDAAVSDATLILAAGTAPDALVLGLAGDYPEQRFAVIGSQTAAANVAAYDVLEKQGAWLAGAAAGLLTRSNVVGYAAGAQSPRLEQLQAAFAAGLAESNPQAQLVGRTMNDSASEWAGAVRSAAAAKADILYLAGENVPSSAFTAGRERNVNLIAHWRDGDRPLESPVTAAVVVDPAEAAFQAGRDLYDAMWKGGTVRRLGVEAPNAVRLALAPGASADLKERMEVFRKRLASGGVKIPDAPAPQSP